MAVTKFIVVPTQQSECQMIKKIMNTFKGLLLEKHKIREMDSRNGQNLMISTRYSPSHKLHEVVIESNASTSVKDTGVSVTNKVAGHNLTEETAAPLMITTHITLSSRIKLLFLPDLQCIQ